MDDEEEQDPNNDPGSDPNNDPGNDPNFDPGNDPGFDPNADFSGWFDAPTPDDSSNFDTSFDAGPSPDDSPPPDDTQQEFDNSNFDFSTPDDQSIASFDNQAIDDQNQPQDAQGDLSLENAPQPDQPGIEPTDQLPEDQPPEEEQPGAQPTQEYNQFNSDTGQWEKVSVMADGTFKVDTIDPSDYQAAGIPQDPNQPNGDWTFNPTTGQWEQAPAGGLAAPGALNPAQVQQLENQARNDTRISTLLNAPTPGQTRPNSPAGQPGAQKPDSHRGDDNPQLRPRPPIPPQQGSIPLLGSDGKMHTIPAELKDIWLKQQAQNAADDKIAADRKFGLETGKLNLERATQAATAAYQQALVASRNQEIANRAAEVAMQRDLQQQDLELKKQTQAQQNAVQLQDLAQRQAATEAQTETARQNISQQQQANMATDAFRQNQLALAQQQNANQLTTEREKADLQRRLLPASRTARRAATVQTI